ncbi:M23 family metallopeptidase [bacterium]|nr:M23 family metallopeptidase [bacterium]NCT19736.1 M23 family metallopeptidase [bacterium]OIO85202.1 MAG: hypothetical protein AUK01_06890 [Anaerolineae bacterium CG2_30_57_67]
MIEIVSPRKLALSIVGLVIALALSLGAFPHAQATPAPAIPATLTPTMVMPATPAPTATMTATPAPTTAQPGFGFACILPVEYGVVTGIYGERRGENLVHRGVDYGCLVDRPLTAVLSPLTGRIAHVGVPDDLGVYGSALGDAVIVESGDGEWRVILAHVSYWRVQPGDLVAAGEPVAVCGSTGESNGAHTHMEIQRLTPGFGWLTVPPENLPGAEGCAWNSLRRLP